MDKQASTTGPKSRARGLERAIAIVDFLHASKKPQRPIDIALGMQAPKSSVYELVGILVSVGVLERVDKDGRVYLGRKLHYWGLSYLDNFDLTRLAHPLLEDITEQTRETSQLCMLDGDKYTVVLMNEGNRQFRISADVGEKLPIPWTASGRLLLGHYTDDEIIDFVPDDDFIMPDGARLDKHEYIASVRSAHEDRFFSFDSLADNYTHCFAAPVLDESGICICTLCLIAPKQDAETNYRLYRDVLTESSTQLMSSLRAGSC